MQTYNDFATKHNVTLSSVSIPQRSSALGNDEEWNKNAFHYLCTLQHKGKTHSFEYSMGCGCWVDRKTGDNATIPHKIQAEWIISHHRDYPSQFDNKSITARKSQHGPKLVECARFVLNNKPATPQNDDVLMSLGLDCSELLSPITFEEWASNYGYDEDSRHAERIFRACQDTAAHLLKLFGREILEELAYETNEDGED